MKEKKYFEGLNQASTHTIDTVSAASPNTAVKGLDEQSENK